ncbi:hypothetical protein AVEN_252352-1 [Araneus ventricosus]|uniref:Uncharacterized protein n=1 Tax=Araneus ventricosus TaxID=182803 RepID=A0A4Y2ASK5_ARAVE|nr:hypothetical protein AVEN_252352-1 [Araneus ventricosus]
MQGQQYEEYLVTDLAILNRGQMTRTAPELPPHLGASTSYQREDVRHPRSDLTCIRPTYTTDLQWNWVSSPEVETLPLGHRGLQAICRNLEHNNYNKIVDQSQNLNQNGQWKELWF